MGVSNQHQPHALSTWFPTLARLKVFGLKVDLIARRMSGWREIKERHLLRDNSDEAWASLDLLSLVDGL